VNVPPGIHIGKSSGDKGTNAFLSLECYSIEERLMGLALEFDEELSEASEPEHEQA
jgi:hypothetical protein